MGTDVETLSTAKSIVQRIDQARRLYLTCASSLRHDPITRPLLEKLRGNIETTSKAMLDLGVVAECRHCEEEEGGSCCGAGIENRYDVVLLLINLLLGVSLPVRVQSGKSCYFLGENGCALSARHVLCVNYICEKLRRRLTEEELVILQKHAGEELDTEFMLHEAIKKKLKVYA